MASAVALGTAEALATSATGAADLSFSGTAMQALTAEALQLQYLVSTITSHHLLRQNRRRRPPYHPLVHASIDPCLFNRQCPPDCGSGPSIRGMSRQHLPANRNPERTDLLGSGRFETTGKVVGFLTLTLLRRRITVDGLTEQPEVLCVRFTLMLR